MTLFLGLGIAGVALLALSLVFDGILEGLFGASWRAFSAGSSPFR